MSGSGFNPRAREGRDCSTRHARPSGSSFNPRAREGRDRRHANGGVRHERVSIHAPARGATRWLRRMRDRAREVSIHAPARGATRRAHRRIDLTLLFQSTRPRGARLRVAAFLMQYYSVSIHAPARGATRVDDVQQVVFDVSIHAPARGATLRHFLAAVRARFQSTRPRGARPPERDRGAARRRVSIHAPARGATRRPRRLPLRRRRFQSTRPRGARRIWIECARHLEQSFNPRAREGRDA